MKVQPHWFKSTLNVARAVGWVTFLEIIRDKKPLTLEVEVLEEEGSNLSDLYLTEPSREAWGEVTKELQRQYDRSRKNYEKYSETSRHKLKELNKELLDKSQESYEKAKGLYEDSRARDKMRRLLSGKNRVVFRA